MNANVYVCASTILVLMLPHLLRFGQPFWAGERPSDALVLGLGYVAILWIASLAGPQPVRRLVAGGLGFAAMGLLIAAVTTLLPAVEISRSLALLTTGLGAALFLAGEFRTALVQAGLLVAGTVATGVLWWTPPPAPAAAGPHVVFSSYETLELVNHGRVVDAVDVHIGGGFARIGNRVVVVTGYGALYELQWDGAQRTIVSRRLPVDRPVDIPSFEPRITTNPAEAVRVTHVIGRSADAGWELFVSHHAWDETAQCVTLVVSAITLTADLGQVVGDWRPVAATQPCLTAERNDLGEGFQGLLSGGRMAWLSPDRLLITIGEHGWDTIAHPLAVSQLDDYDYGKTRILDVASGRLLPFTKGHRNAQGLFIDETGRVWATEHGPRGGDELNLLESGRNYGWPYATLGTEYASLTWPPAASAPADAAFVEPRHAWLPSVGISALIGIRGERLPRWKGNLLAGSLVGKALHRIGLDGDRVLYVETIPVGVRVRDLIEAPGGDIWLWTDDGEVVTIRKAGAEARNATTFTPCTSCHRLAPGEGGGLGPNLFGVSGRAVASDPGFTSYSAALRGIGGVWTDERLDAFLADPEAFAPGSTMYFKVTDPDVRSAVVAFLRTAR